MRNASSTCPTPAAAAERSIEPNIAGILHIVQQQAEIGVGRRYRLRRHDDGQHADACRQRRDSGEKGHRNDERPVGMAFGQRAYGGARQGLIGDDQRLRRAVTRGIGRDDVLALEHAPARLAPLPRRGDERRGSRASADCASR